MDIKTTLAWTKEEPGWYTSPIGGVCHEDNGWWFYPSGLMRVGMLSLSGPFKTKREAIEVAESRK